jgi:hypothetical protein
VARHVNVRWDYDVALKVAGWPGHRRFWDLVLRLTDGYVL